MRVYLMGRALEVMDETTLSALILAHSPFGADPVIALVNGKRQDADASTPLCEDDRIDLYPLLIGG